MLPLLASVLDWRHHVTSAVYSLFGGIAFILIYDLLRYNAGSTTLSNPLKSIPSKQNQNILKLLKKLKDKYKDTFNEEDLYKDITRYLIKELA